MKENSHLRILESRVLNTKELGDWYTWGEHGSLGPFLLPLPVKLICLAARELYPFIINWQHSK